MVVGERRRRISEELVGSASLSFELCQAPPTDDQDLGGDGAGTPDPSPPAARFAGAQKAAGAAVQFREGILPRVFGGGKEVEIIRQELNDHDAKAIATLLSNGVIQKLMLTSNALGDSAATIVAEALETNTTLKTLGLHDNKIGPNGGKALARALRKNETLESLFLSCNQLDAETENDLREANGARPKPMSTASLNGLVLGQHKVAF